MRLLNNILAGCLMGVFMMIPLAWASAAEPVKPDAFQQNSYAHLQKQVGVALFQNKASLQDDRLVTITDDALSSALTEMCKSIAPVRNRNSVFSAFRNHQPRHVSGKIDNMTLLQKGREAGLNAVVTGTITEIREFQEELGYLWFKEMMYFVEVHLHYSVYDTETGAKLLDGFVSEKRDLPEDVYRQLQAKNYDTSFPEIKEGILFLCKQISEEICGKMETELFKTFVKSMDSGLIILTSGKNAGLQPGDLFQIHDSSQIIQGKENQQYFIAGRKTGVLRIDAVEVDSASASVVQGEIKGKDACLKPIVDASFWEDLF